MMFGYLDRARAGGAGGRARPRSRAHKIVLGFANLVEITEAGQGGIRAGDRARSGRSAAPARLGLAQIRESSQAGAQGEVAVGLDANDALLRLSRQGVLHPSGTLANEQYQMAKERPARSHVPLRRDQEADRGPAGRGARDIQKSIELNDNRAVYRSRLLLDPDRAARASLALIYDDLGFLSRASRKRRSR